MRARSQAGVGVAVARAEPPATAREGSLQDRGSVADRSRHPPDRDDTIKSIKLSFDLGEFVVAGLIKSDAYSSIMTSVVLEQIVPQRPRCGGRRAT